LYKYSAIPARGSRAPLYEFDRWNEELQTPTKAAKKNSHPYSYGRKELWVLGNFQVFLPLDRCLAADGLFAFLGRRRWSAKSA
jgi:hypothetical protein